MNASLAHDLMPCATELILRSMQLLCVYFAAAAAADSSKIYVQQHWCAWSTARAAKMPMIKSAKPGHL